MVAAVAGGIFAAGSSLFSGLLGSRQASKQAKELRRQNEELELIRKSSTGLLDQQRALLDEIDAGLNARLTALETGLASPRTDVAQFQPAKTGTDFGTIILGLGVAVLLIRSIGKAE